MSTPSTVDLIKACALRLRNADAEAYDLFCQAIDAYALEVTVAVTEAPQDQILNAQGRAQQMRAILRTLLECHIKRSPSPAVQ